MEGVALEHFNKLKPSNIPTEQFHSNLSDESDQNDITIATHLHILLQFILTKGMIAPFLKTIWDHRDGFTKIIIVHLIFIYYNVLLYYFYYS